MIKSGDIGDLVPDPRERDVPLPDVLLGTIKTDADDTETLLFVKPDGHRHLVGPCRWTAKIVDDSHNGIPEKGDSAIVTFTSEGEPVIVEWWED